MEGKVMIKYLSLLSLVALTFSMNANALDATTTDTTTPAAPINITIPTINGITPTTATTTTTTPAEPPKTFSIAYDDNSPMKDVPLKNATLKMKVWYNGNPSGEIEATTDENQRFDLIQFKDPTAVSLEILSITDQDKYHSLCRNTPDTGNKRDILIICKKST